MVGSLCPGNQGRYTASVVRDRIAYRKAARDGLSVVEMKPSDVKASREMNAFYMEVFNDDEQAAQ